MAKVFTGLRKVLRTPFALLFLIFTSCSHCYVSLPPSPPELVSIHLIDRDGMTEAIANPERLKTYAKTDFLKPQPYQKVLRVYGRDGTGAIRAYITSYHPNGEVKQYLEVVNNRACGSYREWHANGNLKIEASIVEGTADISLAAEKSWLFDGIQRAFDESNNLIAEISYCRGTLEGISRYYHSNGNLWKEVPYKNHTLSGEMRLFLDSGMLLQSTHYAEGMKQGISERFWENGEIAAKEFYEKGALIEGSYSDLKGSKMGEIQNGEGYRAIFSKDSLSELHQYRQGIPDGEVKVFDSKGNLIKLYHVKNGIKHGQETFFYSKAKSEGNKLKPKLSITWYEGKIQGLTKTWYDNGVMESQREMSENCKNGLTTAWYRDGNLMLIEEYEKGKLIKGDYFRKADNYPVSQIVQGTGVATFFDPEGSYLRKINYQLGKPDP